MVVLVTHNHSAVLNLMCCWNVRHASELSEFCTDQILHKLSHWRSHYSLAWKGGTSGWLGVGGRKGGGCINIDLTAILRVWLSKTVFVIIIDGRSPCLMFPQTFLHMESQPVMECLYVCDPAWPGVARERDAQHGSSPAINTLDIYIEGFKPAAGRSLQAAASAQLEMCTTGWPSLACQFWYLC